MRKQNAAPMADSEQDSLAKSRQAFTANLKANLEKPKSEEEWKRVEGAIPKIVKIQSYFKRNHACLQVKALAEERKQRIVQRRAAQKDNPELAVMTEFVTRLQAKDMTPESFFRICDVAYARKISIEIFREALIKYKLRLSPAQTSRLEYIFNEDCSDDYITYTEYQNALEAYDLQCEPHFVGPGPGGKGYVKFETVAVEKLVDLLSGRNMAPAELFGACDVDKSGQISLQELKDMVRNLKESLMEKDLQGISKFFSVMDKDKSGQISRQEFISCFDRASNQVNAKKQDDAQRQAAGEDDFAEANIEQADQGMFTDAISTVKGWFGGKKKQQFANLDGIIPGYSLMSPRSKCDSAVSSLIKEMKSHRVSAQNVYGVANAAKTNKVSVLKLRQAFIKMAPSIDSNLIGDALKSFGDDKVEVEESVFLTTLNAQFDQECNQAIPNSKNNPAAQSFKAKKPRPATASAIVVPTESAQTQLVRKLDNALLRQKLSPLDAFKQADLNQNGVITCDELKLAIKNLLPEESITPADIKMTMIAFDVNRNGQIDEDEFIQCITKARESAPPATPDLGMMNSKGFGMNETISSIGGGVKTIDVDQEEVSIDLLILRIIFANMKGTPSQLNELDDKNLSILDKYWDKNEDPIDEREFTSSYAMEQGLLSEDEASRVCTQLDIDFQKTVQAALNLLFERLRHTSSKMTTELLRKVKSIKLDDKGMASETSLKQIFAAIHFKDRDLFNKFCGIYDEVTGEDCRYQDFQKIFSKPMFVKTLLVSAETLNSKQEGVNGLILATGIWLEDFETLFEGKPESKDWEDIIWNYMAILYDAMDSTKTTQQLHKSMAVHTKALSKVTLRKWIGFLDKNKLRLVSAQNHKCLYMARQTRTILPAVFEKTMSLDQCQQMIESKIDPLRKQADDEDQELNEREETMGNASPIRAQPVNKMQQSLGQGINKLLVNTQTRQTSLKQPKAAAMAQSPSPSNVGNLNKKPATNYQSTREDPILVDLEQTIGCPIQEPLMPYLDQQVVPASELSKQFRKKNKAVTKEQMIALIKACGGLDESKSIAISKLVHFISEEREELELINKALVKLANSIDTPIRESLQTMLMGWEDGIVKDEFLTSFANLRDQIDRWSLICLFYHLDYDDTADETVQLETVVKIICATKGVPYEEPGAVSNQPKPILKNRQSQGQQKQSAQQIVEETKQNVRAAAQKWVDNFENNQKVILDGTKFDMHPADIKPAAVPSTSVDTNMQDFHINNETVLKAIKGLFKLQKVLVTPRKVKETLYRLKAWFDAFEGNEEEAASGYLLNKLKESILSASANSELDEPNVLMFRYGLSTAQDKSGKPSFDLFDLLILTFIMTDRDGLYQLEVDRDFSQRMFEIGDFDLPNEDDRMFALIAESIRRLEIRVHLASLIMKEEKRVKDLGREFNICADEQWRNCRFSRICQLMAEKLKDQNVKRDFVAVFKNSYKNQATYFQFYQAFKNILGIDNVAEWMMEDFLSELDIKDAASVDLNEVGIWLKRYGLDLGERLRDEFTQSEIKRQETGPAEYTLDERVDYYRGIPTILNSEVAALAKCLQLVGEIEQGQHWFDKDFGPQSSDDLEGKANSMYCLGVKPQSHPDPEQVEWLRPSEYLDEGVNAKFVQGDASANEVKQGALGDCWFIGALSVLATRDELLRGQAELVAPELVQLIDKTTAKMLSSGCYPPIFHKFRLYGIYVLRFFKDSVWRYVLIDDRLPCYAGNKALVFGSCTRKDELWVPLIEKAYAKIHGCYQTLISGFIDDGLADLTAMVCEKRQIHNRQGEFNQEKEKFWNYLETMRDQGSLMGCSVTGGTEHAIRIDGVDTGILSGHAYALNDVFEMHDQEMENPRKTHRLLRIRNPWGRGEWKGKWSDDSEQIDQFETQLQEYIDELEEDERFELGEVDGTFMINYASWRDIYNRIFVVNDFPDEWSAVRFHSEWKASCSGGLPIEKTPEANRRFCKNPQFIFTADEDCHMFCSLQQSDGREVKDGKYSKYPFQDRIVSTMLFLFELPPGHDCLKEYGQPQPMEKSTPKVLHEISMRVELKAGKKYAIIPSPRKPGTCGKFHLSIYTSAMQHEFDVWRADDPTNRYGFIAEEYDKTDRRVPKWKVLWCQENLKHMIGKDDFEMSMSASKSTNLKLKSAKTLKKSTAGGRRKTTVQGKKSAMMKDLATSLKTSLSNAVDAEDEDCGEGLE